MFCVMCFVNFSLENDEYSVSLFAGCSPKLPAAVPLLGHQVSVIEKLPVVVDRDPFLLPIILHQSIVFSHHLSFLFYTFFTVKVHHQLKV